MHQYAATTPPAPPIKERTRLSVTNRDINFAGVAPSASRVATSRHRATTCATTRLETFKHPMARMKTTAPNKTSKVGLTSLVPSSFKGMVFIETPEFAAG